MCFQTVPLLIRTDQSRCQWSVRIFAHTLSVQHDGTPYVYAVDTMSHSLDWRSLLIRDFKCSPKYPHINVHVLELHGNLWFCRRLSTEPPLRCFARDTTALDHHLSHLVVPSHHGAASESVHGGLKHSTATAAESSGMPQQLTDPMS